MEHTFDKWLVGAGGLVALLGVAVVLTFENTRRLNEDASWVAHTHEVIDALEESVGHMREAEVVQRTYVITGDEARRPQITTSLDAAKQNIEHVKVLTQDNQEQQDRIPDVQKQIEEVARLWIHTANVRKEQGFDAAKQVIQAEQDSKATNDLHGLLRQMVETERALLRVRATTTEQTYRSALVTGLLSGLAALAGVVAFMVLLRRHLAERTRASLVIAEQGERLRTTLASIGDAVITTDTQGRITNLNPVAETLTGWASADAVGQPLDVVFNIINEDTRQPVENPATRALRDGVIVGLANHTILLARDGTERPLDDSAAPIRCKEGEIVGCVLVFRDVTERRRFERERQEEERRFRMLVEQVKDYAIFMTDAKGRATTWTEGVKLVLGFDEAEWLGKNIVPLIFPPEDVQNGVPEAELHQAATNGSASDDRWMMKKDGTRFFASGVTTAQKNEDKLLGFTKIMRDQTERKKLEDQLRQLASELSEADRRKNEFLATLAHELRNPLAPIRNGLQLIRLAKGDAETVGQARSMMERQLTHLVRLVDDLLDVSRISRGKVELKMERIELASVINHAVEAVRPSCEKMELELTVLLPSEPIYLNGDPTRLAQVVGNLLNNACKFTNKGGQVWLTAERKDSQAVIRVRDTGIGIAADQLPHIFEMFTQADASLERTSSGLGIGLTLVRSLVEMHGGTVEGHSAGLGQGSEFIVHLPIAVELSPPQSLQEPSGGEEGAMIARRMLVVDDNRDAAESLAMLIRLTGHEVHLAYDGVEAVEAAEKFRPDVVFMDIGMPKLNGYEAARRLREQPWGKSMVLIAVTGWGQEENIRRSQETGFNGYLVKPVEPRKLQELLAAPGNDKDG